MVTQQQVMDEVWPVVEALITATAEEDDAAVSRQLAPGEAADALHELFGFAIFELLLKMVLGREQLGLTRAIETEGGRFVYVEFAWPEPGANRYTAADVVAVRLVRRDRAWRVAEINPAAADLPLTEPRARTVLLTSQVATDADGAPQEAWILPVALYAGALQLPLRPAALADPVEALLLPGLQHRTYGVLSLLNGRRLWRDFRAAAEPALDQPAAWAAAAEFILSEQSERGQTQAAVAQAYAVGLSTLLPRVRQIKSALNIQGLDERYTAIQRTQIILNPPDS